MDLALTCIHETGVRFQAVIEDNNIKGIISFKDLTVYYKNNFITKKYRRITPPYKYE